MTKHSGDNRLTALILTTLVIVGVKISMKIALNVLVILGACAVT
jgi:hypothetical protein